MSLRQSHLFKTVTILLFFCAIACSKSEPSADLSLRWFQESAECRALFIQGYALARQRLQALPPPETGKQQAVVLDIDETVLDNSPQQAGVALGKSKPESWDDWCQAALAEPLPGALEFLKEVDRLGLAIFYISNRDQKHLEASKRNLAKWGFPQAETDHLLLRQKENSKEGRRRDIADKHQIVLLLGDNLNDLAAAFESDDARERTRQVDLLQAEFAHRFIVFPNPMYGAWKSAKPFPRDNSGLRIWPNH